MQNNILDYLELTKENLPEKIAYCDSEGESITFLQLYKDVRTIGSYILDKTSESNKPIVVFTERNIKSISSFLGVTYSGNFYIPVDATLPDDRLDVMLELSDPLLVINCTDRVYNNNKYKIVHCSDILASKNNDYDKKQIMGNDPLYGIFTSGSTGLPKLVVKNHMSLISFIDEYTKTFNFNKTDILGNQIPFYFDASTKDLFTTLKVGCTTNIIHKSYFAQPGKLAEYIENNNITSICWVPSALNMLSMFNVFTKYPLKNITRVLFVGEAMHVKQLNIWINALPWAYFVNLYGSTENAGNCLYHIIKEPLDSDKVPIGKPFDNAKIFLLDDEDKLISTTD
ncbi:MAG: AMP-binding protein, partial [Clostridia bacterium]|nr:AMP-binding protein [Clostridia bacterium]